MTESSSSVSAPCPGATGRWRQADSRRVPVVSLLLPAGDDDRDLGARLAAALAQTMPPHEILVLDTSADGRHFATFSVWSERPTRPVLRYLPAPGVGPRDARKRGSRLAADNIRVVVSPGHAPTSTWLARLVAQLRRGLTSTAAAGALAVNAWRPCGAVS
ncbi:hypothetical protein F6B41_07950 [Microbacterium lushaniae]|nr:hypothetical protein F6B41_28590 [Microbacterium lushaniae]KAA9156501.1 hypothetical protein F6B41_07950 [Microbacterium lushaniae]